MYLLPERDCSWVELDSEKLSWEEARDRERQYFETTPIWANSTAVNRLGTLNLTKNLSRLLSGLIDQTYVLVSFFAVFQELTPTQPSEAPPRCHPLP